MSLTLITAPTIEPISLAEARAQCRIDGTDEDTLLTIYIAAARQKAEGETQSALITQTWEQKLDEFPDAGIRIGKPPILTVVSVKYDDIDGTEQTLTAGTHYTVDTATGYVNPAVDTEWPDTNDAAGALNCVRIRFTAGFGPAATDVPAAIRSWMLLTIAYLHAQREAVDATGKAAAIPSRFVDSLLDPWRNYAL